MLANEEESQKLTQIIAAYVTFQSEEGYNEAQNYIEGSKALFSKGIFKSLKKFC